MPRIGSEGVGGDASAANQVRIATELERNCDINKSGLVNNGTAVLHTVTSGKTFHLVSAFCAANMFSGTPQSGQLFVRDESDVIQYYIFYLFTLSNGMYKEVLSFWPPLGIPEGFDVCIFAGTVGISTRGSIFGYEV